MREEVNLSVEMRALELFNNFAGFIKLMQKPDEYASLVRSTQKVLDDRKAILGPLAVKERADEYLEDIKAYEIELEAKHTEASKVFEDECAQKRIEMDKQVQVNLEILQATKKAHDQQVELSNKTKEESVELVRFKTELDRRDKALEQRQHDLDTRDAELQLKTKKLQQLLG